MTDNVPRKRGFRPINKPAAATPPTSQSEDIDPPVRNRIRPVITVSDLEPKVSEASPERYGIGYKRPPKHAQFQPGQSGNPKGRKKGAKGMKTLAQKTLTAKVAVRTGNGLKQMTRIEALLHKMVEVGMKGNHRALLALFNMYQSAVPEIVDIDMEQVTQPLSESDEAALAALKEILLAEGGAS